MDANSMDFRLSLAYFGKFEFLNLIFEVRHKY